MIRRIGDPHFSLPRYRGQIFFHCLPSKECSDIHQTNRCESKKFPKLVVALWVDRPVRGYGLDQYKPMLRGVIDNHIGHFSVRIDCNAQFSQTFLGKEGKLLICVADVQYLAIRSKSRRKLIDYLLDQDILPTWREP
jgi:hypothetical protein